MYLSWIYDQSGLYSTSVTPDSSTQHGQSSSNKHCATDSAVRTDWAAAPKPCFSVDSACGQEHSLKNFISLDDA